MKPLSLIGCVLAAGLVVATPTVTYAHVGHGDEFQAEGGINRVPVNSQTDQLMGIMVTPIKPATDGSTAILVPATALVDADGKQLVFVQYENFYEPVPITTGTTKGELIEVTNGLSVGEKLVTQGGLSLYAESRKTQTATASPSPVASKPATTTTDTAHAQADAQGIPHSHDKAGNLVASAEATQQPGNFPSGLLIALGGGIALLVGGLAVIADGRKKKNSLSNKEENL
ncbi:cobalt transporter [Ancylothrix sp. C2]|uniref:efflux RND transporter periplasmic adaptor subunit n=1 Tax=Ancylothrix sp. D3o TaxID=2953691 RepID=UPI0021BA98B6|nr:efflux RND transporter periplasmic adaptor subunit [Ancylothrix sp. D3o]MCT7952280.1 cobalt transporter [Ancylothrix sp. D3o]